MEFYWLHLWYLSLYQYLSLPICLSSKEPLRQIRHRSISYKERLRAPELFNLKKRRLRGKHINVYKYVKKGGQENGARKWCPAAGQETENKPTQAVSSQKKVFYCEGGWVLAHFAQGDCGLHYWRYSKVVLPLQALDVSTWARGWHFQSCIPISTILWCIISSTHRSMHGLRW